MNKQMNRQMNRAMINRAQSGFTLIELIVVIVILGILAATALPKFADLGSDARRSTLNAAKGSLAAAAAMAHGKFLVSATPGSSVAIEGTTVTLATNGSGYPAAGAAFATAAGLNAQDYTQIPANTTASTTNPGSGANAITFVPVSVTGTTASVTCFVRYTEPATKTDAPEIVLSSEGC